MAQFTDEQLKPITTGSSIKVDGILVESMGKGQSVEVQAKSLEIFGTADPENYPLQKKGHTLEFLREKAHLRPRYQYIRCDTPCAQRPCVCHPQVFPGKRILLSQHSAYHGKRLRGCRCHVPGDYT